MWNHGFQHPPPVKLWKPQSQGPTGKSGNRVFICDWSPWVTSVTMAAITTNHLCFNDLVVTQHPTSLILKAGGLLKNLLWIKLTPSSVFLEQIVISDGWFISAFINLSLLCCFLSCLNVFFICHCSAVMEKSFVFMENLK